MTKNAEFIKASLRIELEKRGRTMEEFEQYLRQSPNQKTAFDASQVGDVLKGLANIYGLTAVGAGAGLGYGGYKAYQSMRNSDEEIAKKQSEKRQYIDATRRLMAAQHDSLNDASMGLI